MKHTKSLVLHLIFSFIAVVLVILLVITTPTADPPLSFIEKAGIGSVFIFCSGIGIWFTIRPNWFRGYLFADTIKETYTPSQKKRSFQGHHPECQTFHTHTIRWRKKTRCAGCFGLLIGLCIAILLMILYLSIEVQFTKTNSFLLTILGLSMLTSVYSEIYYQSRYSVVHVYINSLLPLSFFLLTIAVGESTGQVVYSFFTILICVLWLDTRIHLSRWHHRRLCIQCDESCKMFNHS